MMNLNIETLDKKIIINSLMFENMPSIGGHRFSNIYDLKNYNSPKPINAKNFYPHIENGYSLSIKFNTSYNKWSDIGHKVFLHLYKNNFSVNDGKYISTIQFNANDYSYRNLDDEDRKIMSELLKIFKFCNIDRNKQLMCSYNVITGGLLMSIPIVIDPINFEIICNEDIPDIYKTILDNLIKANKKFIIKDVYKYIDNIFSYKDFFTVSPFIQTINDNLENRNDNETKDEPKEIIKNKPKSSYRTKIKHPFISSSSDSETESDSDE